MSLRKKLILILTVIGLCIIATGCGSLSVFKSDDKAEKTVKEFLTAVSKDDTEKAKTFLVNPNEYESLTSVARNIGMDQEKTKKFTNQYKSIKFTVKDSEKGSDPNKVTVMVFITVPDYSGAFADGLAMINNNMNNSQAMKTIIEKMADTKPDTVRKAVAVSVVKNGDKWLIDYSNNNIELLNAINGNILNALHGKLAM